MRSVETGLGIECTGQARYSWRWGVGPGQGECTVQAGRRSKAQLYNALGARRMCVVREKQQCIVNRAEQLCSSSSMQQPCRPAGDARSICITHLGPEGDSSDVRCAWFVESSRVQSPGGTAVKSSSRFVKKCTVVNVVKTV